ncbi:MAG: hypothetical protein M1834_007209 [Cirrosporium novae-zelandiae]|nr:MAG: hypothetical protein M1834_007209 [Cirrosporium novae-zelandiae]
MNSPIPQNPNGSARPCENRRRRTRLGPRFWHRPNCDVVVAIDGRERHSCSSAISDSSLSHDTPLNRFFLSYPSFRYNRSLPPSESFNSLRRYKHWGRDDPKGEEAWNQYQNALKNEFQLWYGAEDDLGGWHALCRAIRIKPLPTTCEDCEKAVRHRHVNLIDLIEWGRKGGESGGKEVRVFGNIAELSEYSKRTHKIFQNTLNEDKDDGGVILRHLLGRLFNKRPKGDRIYKGASQRITALSDYTFEHATFGAIIGSSFGSRIGMCSLGLG